MATTPSSHASWARPASSAAALGLSDDFVVDVISAVGNYGEIYDRAFGPETALALEPRGHRQRPLDEGGLMYSPPFR